MVGGVCVCVRVRQDNRAGCVRLSKGERLGPFACQRRARTFRTGRARVASVALLALGARRPRRALATGLLFCDADVQREGVRWGGGGGRAW